MSAIFGKENNVVPCSLISQQRDILTQSTFGRAHEGRPNHTPPSIKNSPMADESRRNSKLKHYNKGCLKISSVV